MPDIIRVDPDALELLAERCERIACQLDTLESSVFDPDAATMGDARLASTLDDYYGHWSRKRQDLTEDLRSAAVVLDAVAQSFRDVDEELAGALAGHVGPGAGDQR